MSVSVASPNSGSILSLLLLGGGGNNDGLAGDHSLVYAVLVEELLWLWSTGGGGPSVARVVKSCAATLLVVHWFPALSGRETHNRGMMLTGTSQDLRVACISSLFPWKIWFKVNSCQWHHLTYRCSTALSCNKVNFHHLNSYYLMLLSFITIIHDQGTNEKRLHLLLL